MALVLKDPKYLPWGGFWLGGKLAWLELLKLTPFEKICWGVFTPGKIGRIGVVLMLLLLVLLILLILETGLDTNLLPKVTIGFPYEAALGLTTDDY